MSRALPLAVTLGEPAGVGPELVALAWNRRAEDGLAPFYCLSDPAFMSSRLAAAGIAAPLRIIDSPSGTAASFEDALPVLPLANQVLHGAAGKPSPRDAGAVIESIERAVGDVRDGEARAVVTGPVQKEALYEAGFPFPGHTEFLAELTRDWGGSARPVMMLVAPDLRAVPVTVHVPLEDVPGLVNENLIVETARIVAGELAARFSIPAPRLAISGLNPHAGEGGRLGTQEREVIAPAIARLRAEGIDAGGPYPADTLFHRAARAKYDAALTMYHDQALIAVKTLAFESAVNLTLGLPLIRTSPDHGTALALAGTGRADPSSFIAALKLADELTRT